MNVQSSLIHHIQRVETIQMSFNRQLVETWFIHTMEYYSSTRRNEVLTDAATGMNPENIALSKSIQTQKGSHVICHMKFPEWANHREKVEQWLPGDGGNEGVRLTAGKQA